MYDTSHSSRTCGILGFWSLAFGTVMCEVASLCFPAGLAETGTTWEYGGWCKGWTSPYKRRSRKWHFALLTAKGFEAEIQHHNLLCVSISFPLGCWFSSFWWCLCESRCTGDFVWCTISWTGSYGAEVYAEPAPYRPRIASVELTYLEAFMWSCVAFGWRPFYLKWREYAI